MLTIVYVLVSAGLGWSISHWWIARYHPSFKTIIDGAWIVLTAAGVIMSVAQFASSSSRTTGLMQDLQALDASEKTTQAVAKMTREASAVATKCKSKGLKLSITISGTPEDLCKVLDEEAAGLNDITAIHADLNKILAYQEDPSRPRGKSGLIDFASDHLRINRTAVGTRSALLCEARNKLAGDATIRKEPQQTIFDTIGTLCDVYREESESLPPFVPKRDELFSIPTGWSIAWFIFYAFFAGARVATVTMPSDKKPMTAADQPESTPLTPTPG
ncbi:hypothetical protein ACFFWD_35540 [Bradyrhizobium erythrophlei]|uniref:hypothetical protein n=1 Tax=Bradyrhizobium erythrophlei TaxID=1437360 RepID=UPI0035ED2E7E